MMTELKSFRRGDSPRSDSFDGARHRVAPICYIVDRDLRILMATDDAAQADDRRLPEPVASAVKELVAAASAANVMNSKVVNGTLVRIASLAGPTGTSLGVFVETLRGRDALASAIERYGLSVREADVLSCLSFGERTKVIAKALGISEATVSDHVKSIMAKMNCHSRTQLLARVFGPS